MWICIWMGCTWEYKMKIGWLQLLIWNQSSVDWFNPLSLKFMHKNNLNFLMMYKFLLFTWKDRKCFVQENSYMIYIVLLQLTTRTGKENRFYSLFLSHQFNTLHNRLSVLILWHFKYGEIKICTEMSFICNLVSCHVISFIYQKKKKSRISLVFQIKS